jgi:hypothetical protein
METLTPDMITQIYASTSFGCVYNVSRRLD